MAFVTGKSGRRGLSLSAVTAGVALTSLLVASPAMADGDMWNSMLGWVGLGHKQAADPEDSAIDYRPRPALVVPPKMDLPPPQAAAGAPPNWPHDPDAAIRARAEADSRRPAPSSDSANDDQSANASSVTPAGAKPEPAVKEACTNDPGTPICVYGPSDLLNFTKGWDVFSSKAEDTSKLRVGVEPRREFLTQPPPGYRMPKVQGEDDDTQTQAADDVEVGAPRHHHHEKVSSTDSN